MPRIRRRSGFTLIEMLIVVVVVGLLAAICIARFRDTKGKGYAAALKSDLKNLTSLQEAYFYSNNTYAPSLGTVNFNPTDGVQLSISEATANGWSAVATHPAAWPLTCAVYYGQAAPVSPAVNEGMINCQ